MRIEFGDELLERGIARGVREFLEGAGLEGRIADVVMAQLQLLDYSQAAAVLGISERSVGDLVNEKRKLSKVTFLGTKEPRLLLGEILERVRTECARRVGLKQEELPLIFGMPDAQPSARATGEGGCAA